MEHRPQQQHLLLRPERALTFFLGGQPGWLVNTSGDLTLADGTTKVLSTQPITGFLGFSANPANPFDNSASRTKPLYDFDIPSVGWQNGIGLVYWPKVQTVTAKTAMSSIVYFRAENTYYTVSGLPAVNSATTSTTNIKSQNQQVWPAYDTRLSNPSTPLITWINPQSFQIFASGRDLQYGSPTNANTSPFYGLAFPAGTNYAPQTYDDITNFSGGRLDSAIP